MSFERAGPNLKEEWTRETLMLLQMGAGGEIWAERFHSKFKTWRKGSETCTNNSFLAQGVVQISWVTTDKIRKGHILFDGTKFSAKSFSSYVSGKIVFRLHGVHLHSVTRKVVCGSWGESRVLNTWSAALQLQTRNSNVFAWKKKAWCRSEGKGVVKHDSWQQEWSVHNNGTLGPRST